MARWCKTVILLIGCMIFLVGCTDGRTILNDIPEANAGLHQFVQTGSTVQLDGSNSIDPNGSNLKYKWTFEHKPYSSSAILSNDNTANPTFIADQNGVYLVKLVVNDGGTESVPVFHCVNATKGYQRLNYEVIDAEYSNGLEKLIMVSKNPDQLHIFDPVTNVETVVELLMIPEWVSLSPDGLFAVVSHERGLSYVNLSTGSLVKVIPYEMLSDIYDIQVANNYAYLFGSSYMHSIDLDTGKSTKVEVMYGYLQGKVHPNGKGLYVTGGAEIAKYDITAGPASFLYKSDNHLYTRNLWLSDTGDLILDYEGRVLSSADTEGEDLQVLGELEELPSQISSAAIATSKKKVYAIQKDFHTHQDLEDCLWIYDLNTYAVVDVINFPLIPNGYDLFLSRGKFVFKNSSDDRIYGVIQFDEEAEMKNTFAIVTY